MEKRKSQVDKYRNQKRRKHILTAILLALLFVLAFASLLIGRYGVSAYDCVRIIFGFNVAGVSNVQTIRDILVNIRIPRTIAAILIGGSLSIAGLTYQCVFRNVLVSQDVLGVSSGACVGAALAIVMNLSAYQIQLFAFATGLLSVFFVFVLSRVFKSESTLSLVLSGILISGLMSSMLGYIKFTANPETYLQNIEYWIMGDISSVNLAQIGQVLIPTVICLFLIILNRWKLNFFCYSDHEASNLGFPIRLYRGLFLMCATILVSLSVSISGAIGWIGLVIPQLVRTIIGHDNNDTAGLSFILGANFLLLMDIVNRLISSAELPASILTGMVGTPIFVICLLLKRRGEKNHAGH